MPIQAPIHYVLPMTLARRDQINSEPQYTSENCVNYANKTKLCSYELPYIYLMFILNIFE